MSGDKTFKNHLDVFIKKFQQEGYEVSIFRSFRKGDMGEEGLNGVNNEEYDSVIVSGGDGSINEVVEGMIKKDISIPLGILPFGTANDFATHIGMPLKRLEECCDIILRKRIKKIDVGQANGQYFINVCGAGLLTNVSQNININFKNVLGKMAYYIKGIEQLPNFKPIPVRISTKNEVLLEDIYLFLILNGKSAGGFDKLAKNAVLDDGLLDLLVIKATPLHELMLLFIKILQGEHLSDRNIIHLKEKYFRIECLSSHKSFYQSDIDGEKGPHLPLEISVLPQRLPVYVNMNDCDKGM